MSAFYIIGSGTQKPWGLSFAKRNRSFMSGDLCGAMKGKLNPKHCKDSRDLNNGRKQIEVSSPNIDDGAGRDCDGEPSFEEGKVHATRLSSSLATGEALDDMEEDHVHLVARSNSKCRRPLKLRTRGSNVESFGDGYAEEENTYGGGNVLSEGVFIDIISHAQAQGRMSLGCEDC